LSNFTGAVVKISTKLHTVFIFAGPEGCGKSSFGRHLQGALTQQLRGKGIMDKAIIVSLDNERRNLLGISGLLGTDPLMAEVSEQALAVFMAKYEASITFPSNNAFVILDTSGMSADFRKQVARIADRNEYRTELILFNYSYEVVTPNVKKFTREVMSNLSVRYFDTVFEVNEQDEIKWSKMEVIVEDIGLYARSNIFLPADSQLVVIGDSHEHTVALETLLAQLDTLPNIGPRIMAGDYLDKGGNTRKSIELVEKFIQDGGLVVHGNHENYAAKRILGKLKDIDHEVEAKHMTSIATLLEDSDLAARFLKIWENSVPFLRVMGPKVRSMYITHAPCENKYLGKMSAAALVAQRTLNGDYEDYRRAYPFIFEEARSNHPLHVFGHVAHCSDNLKYRNKIFLDTGAVYGGRLTALIYENSTITYKSVKADSVAIRPKLLQDFLTTPLESETGPGASL
jgi:DNA polymerase III delta prime subunit